MATLVFDQPKSASLRQSGKTSRFSGLRSRWMIGGLRECR
jgi:hypothetical protein